MAMARQAVLLTAGPVYGKLDDNKIVSNRSRGLWATHLVPHLLERGYEVFLLVPDIMEKQFREKLGSPDRLNIIAHDGYHTYATYCHAFAKRPEAHTAIMAAAVLNYIPKHTVKGKMPTVEKEINIPFVLAPRVINEMRRINPSLTLIGCKLLFSGELDKLVEAAYHVVLESKCHAVIANDGVLGLKKKWVVHQDKTVTLFDDDFPALYEHITAVMADEHYQTVVGSEHSRNLEAVVTFDTIVNRYRERFIRRVEGEPFAFGSVAVPNPIGGKPGVYLVSPREKGELFTASDAVLVREVRGRTVHTWGGKATLNAPLLIRHLEKYPEAAGVVHYHEDAGKGQWPVVEHAPPGTVRDNQREIPAASYYIEGHGWIIAVDAKGEPLA